MIKRLHRELEDLQRDDAAGPVIADKHRALAEAYQAATETAPDPWPCIASAVMHLAEAGDLAEARHVLEAGRDQCRALAEHGNALERWLDERASA